MRRDRLETITDNILLVRGKNKGKFPSSHSILILDKEVVLVDTGCGIETLEEITREYDVSYVINSHTHPDHSAGNWLFNDRSIHVPEEGFDTSGNVVALSERFVDKRLAPIWQKFAKEIMGFKNCKPTDIYNSKTIFRFGKIFLRPIYTPGHTKDHYCFFEEREGILFSFDYDLTRFPWYGHRESSIPEFRESVKKLKALCPKVVVSSHRGIITEDIDLEFDNFYRKIDERNEKILSLLENGKTFDQLVDCAPIYGVFPYAKPLLRYWEGQMIKKHLEELRNCSEIGEHGKVYIRSKEKSGH